MLVAIDELIGSLCADSYNKVPRNRIFFLPSLGIVICHTCGAVVIVTPPPPGHPLPPCLLGYAGFDPMQLCGHTTRLGGHYLTEPIYSLLRCPWGKDDAPPFIEALLFYRL